MDPVARYSVHDCERIIDQLRHGLPPVEFIEDFTVGRDDELHKLGALLSEDSGTHTLLVEADYGTGKSHLLQLLRAKALNAGYIVSLVEVSARNGVRFNRMDQVAAAVYRHLEFGDDGRQGIGRLFDDFEDALEWDDAYAEERQRISDDGEWSVRHGANIAFPLWLTLRGYLLGNEEAQHLSLQWLTDDDRMRIPRHHLHRVLVERVPMMDSWETWDQRRVSPGMDVTKEDYRRSWQLLNGLQTVAKLAGYRGVVLLFDEFEDVLQNLHHREYERTSLENLYRFDLGMCRVPSYFSVTPEFMRKATALMLEKGQYEFDFAQLEKLKRVGVSPMDERQFRTLADLVVATHARAYQWHMDSRFVSHAIDTTMARHWVKGESSRVRLSMTSLIARLDEHVES